MVTVGSDNPYPSILMVETVDPATPAAGTQRLFVDTDGILKLIDDAAVVTEISSLVSAAAHIADASDAHDASAISIVDAGPYFTGTDVEAALQEIGAGSAGIPATIFDAKGDLIAASAADTAARLAAGTNNTNVLVPDSAQSTGLKWDGYVGCRLYNSGVQSISAGADTALTFDSEEFDSDGFHDTGSNTSRITIPAGFGGLYVFEFGTYATTNDLATQMSLRQDGTTKLRGTQTYWPVSATAITVHRVILQEVAAGEYFEVLIHNDHTSAVNFGHASAGEVQSVFACHLVR